MLKSRQGGMAPPRQGLVTSTVRHSGALLALTCVRCTQEARVLSFARRSLSTRKTTWHSPAIGSWLIRRTPASALTHDCHLRHVTESKSPRRPQKPPGSRGQTSRLPRTTDGKGGGGKKSKRKTKDTSVCWRPRVCVCARVLCTCVVSILELVLELSMRAHRSHASFLRMTGRI